VTETAPLILWVRRDLRLDDNPMLAAAAADGRPVIPVFICDAQVSGIGVAPRWRWGLGVAAFAERLAGLGLRLILRRGEALAVLRALVAETGASGVWWARLYDEPAVVRDTAVKAALKAAGVEARSFPGHLLVEPWEVATKAGEPFKVYTPFWRAVSARDWPAPVAAPKALRAPAAWPASDRLADWGLGAAMNRGAGIVAPHLQIGDIKATARLAAFLERGIAGYATERDRVDRPGTSGLSENLTYGEIGPRRAWAAVQARLGVRPGDPGPETWGKELVWREFAHHLAHHTPRLLTGNWRPEWDSFGWRGDSAEAERWRRGMTGEPIVDAGMRELYVTGRMHNRVRMIVASYLTKHLLTHWKIGLDWFADTLVDWDPAANAMGWQWVAGSGPDAAPYFRIFNPATQAAKFDPDRRYRRAWIAEGQADPPATARAFFAAVPRSWGAAPTAPYPRPLVDLAEGRARALAAYAARAEKAVAGETPPASFASRKTRPT
jgi:deoxyribodipyrimidine photo-lyase